MAIDLSSCIFIEICTGGVAIRSLNKMGRRVLSGGVNDEVTRDAASFSHLPKATVFNRHYVYRFIFEKLCLNLI